MNSTPVPFSPIAIVGTITLLAAYLIAAWSAAAGIAGNARRSRRLVTSSVYGLYAFGALAGLASALMIYAFVTHDFSIKYVASTSDVNMPVWYKVTSFWGGLDGSLLFWVLVLALFSVVAVAANARRHRDMMGFVVGTIMVVQVFFLSLLIFHKNPFATFLTEPPKDGMGLNPLLQNYWMVIHPPVLYIGFVSATIPFAFGIGALASGRLDDLWIGSVRVWMLISFLFLSVGLILGGRWAYEELGWGGYWAWDPVENAGLIPWFTATAFLHSSIIQEQRGMMKQWNLAMVVLTFFLTIFGTFMTRSGVVQSVHAFGEDNVLALYFILFMALTLIVSVGLIVYRSNKLSMRLEFESFISREFAFLLNNWILLGCAFFVLFATMFPTISEALDGSRVSVGIEFFNKWMTPLGLVLLFLAGAAPLLAWRKTTAQRLIQQFLFPTILMAMTIGVLIVLGQTGVLPRVILLTPIFADSVKLPVSLVNFGLCAFVFGSILQELWRGAAVRRRQTGSDPFTSLLRARAVEAAQVRRLHRPPRRGRDVRRLRRQGLRPDGRSHDREAGDRRRARPEPSGGPARGVGQGVPRPGHDRARAAAGHAVGVRVRRLHVPVRGPDRDLGRPQDRGHLAGLDLGGRRAHRDGLPGEVELPEERRGDVGGRDQGARDRGRLRRAHGL